MAGVLLAQKTGAKKDAKRGAAQLWRRSRLYLSRDCMGLSSMYNAPHFIATGASVPIPKFATLCGKLFCELRNRKDTRNYVILVWFLDLKSLNEQAEE